MSAPTIEAAHAMGTKGGPVVEAERLAFEAWMAGHCWALGATWDGKHYIGEAEKFGDLSPRAMMTRQLWAAWRDRAALAQPTLSNGLTEAETSATASVMGLAKPAAPVPFKGWYCAHCQRGVDASEVSYHEQHTACGRVISDDVPPATHPAPGVPDADFDLICNAIDKADTITMEGDYMLDSDDCIAVVRVMQALLSVRAAMLTAAQAQKGSN